MRNNSMAFRNSGTYTSPGTPDYADNNVGGHQRGWCSERVPLPANSRRHISATALIPFSSGRALPSKWDDADRWITSPLSGNGAFKTPLVQTQRHHKSKSGPLGDTGGAYFPNYSTAELVLKGSKSRGFMAGSPFTTGVLIPDGISLHYGGGIGVQGNIDQSSFMAQSDNTAGWTEFLSDSSPSSSKDQKLDDTEDTETKESYVVSRRDMATQMSPEGSQKGRLSFLMSPLSAPLTEDPDPRSNYSMNFEVRDVQVDKGATVTRQTKETGVRMTDKSSPDFDELVSTWNIAGVTKNTSKLSKEEARIAAWENLQKAKADAAIKKLEMKLEKKRTSSMDRILNKLRTAQMKAQDLRESISDNHANKASTSKHKVATFKKYVKMGSFGGCFRGQVNVN